MRIFTSLVAVRLAVLYWLYTLFRLRIRISLLLVRIAGGGIMAAIAGLAAGASEAENKNGENLPNLTHSV